MPQRPSRMIATAAAALALLGAPAFSVTATAAPTAPDSSAAYTLPYAVGSGAWTTVGTSEGSHADATSGRWAIDVADAGTPGFTVLAARGGVVRGVRGDSDVGCGDLSCWTQANYVLIDHRDGTSGLYLHLAPGRVVVHEGDVVARGQKLGIAGSTGFSTGTHLHFQVQTTPCLTDTCRQQPGWWWSRSVEVTFDEADDETYAAAGAPAISGSREVATKRATDWQNTTYTLSCGGLSSRPVTITVHDGQGIVPEDRDHRAGYQVTVGAVAAGDLTGDGRAETAVLLWCGRLGDNYSVPDVLVFTGGRNLLAELPPLEPYPGGMGHEMNRDAFSVRDGKLVTGVGYYVPRDIHVVGPSIYVTLLWQWDGQRFATTLPFGPSCRPGVDSVAVANVCIEIPSTWIAVRDVSTWLGADWVDVRPYGTCNPATHCVGFRVYAATAFDRALAGNTIEKPFAKDGDQGWWPGAGTPKCYADYYSPNPVTDTELVVSDVRPFGSELADYRQWTITCQHSDPQEVRAWILPASRLLVVSGPLPADLQDQVSSVVAGATA